MKPTDFKAVKSNKAKILIAEDENITSLEMKKSLEKVGYEVVDIVNSGEDAIKVAKEEKPDLVLMDIKLRGKIDGIEAAIKIHSLDINVIFITAFEDEATVQRAKSAGPFEYIVKPYDEEKLISTIEAMLVA